MSRPNDQAPWAPLALALDQAAEGGEHFRLVVKPPPAKLRQRRLRWRMQFSLRSWFVVLTLCCVALAGLGRWLVQAEQQRRTVAELERLGWRVYYEDAGFVSPWLPFSLPPDYLSRPRQVTLKYGSVSAACVESFNRLPPCEVNVDISDRGGLLCAAPLAALRHPLSLSVNLRHMQPQPKPSELEALFRLPALRVLAVSGKPCDDQCLRVLAKANNLESLYLSDTSVTGAGLAELAELPRLRRLTLDTGWLEDNTPQLAAVAYWPALRELQIHSRWPLPKDALRWLALSKSLREIEVQAREIGRETGRALAALPQLERLAVHEVDDGAGFVHELARAPRLQSLEVQSGVDNDLLALLPHLPQLREFECYEGRPELSLDEGAADLARCRRLEVLRVGKGLTDVGVELLAQAPRLQVLRASGEISNDGVRALLRNRQIRELSVHSAFVDNGVAADLALARHLERLDLTGTGITMSQRLWIADRLPGCRCQDARCHCCGYSLGLR